MFPCEVQCIFWTHLVLKSSFQYIHFRPLLCGKGWLWNPHVWNVSSKSCLTIANILNSSLPLLQTSHCWNLLIRKSLCMILNLVLKTCSNFCVWNSFDETFLFFAGSCSENLFHAVVANPTWGERRRWAPVMRHHLVQWFVSTAEWLHSKLSCHDLFPHCYAKSNEGKLSKWVRKTEQEKNKTIGGQQHEHM